jgi:hypothetical protein
MHSIAVSLAPVTEALWAVCALININRGGAGPQQKRLSGLLGKTARISNGGWINADRT